MTSRFHSETVSRTIRFALANVERMTRRYYRVLFAFLARGRGGRGTVEAIICAYVAVLSLAVAQQVNLM